MTENRIRELFALWKHRLGLDPWTIELKVEMPPGDNGALLQVRTSTKYNRAVISVPPWLLSAKPKVPDHLLDITVTEEFIEVGIVHELLHCQRSRTKGLVIDRLDGQVHRDAYTVIVDSYDDAEELEIENLAMALVKAWGEK